MKFLPAVLTTLPFVLFAAACGTQPLQNQADIDALQHRVSELERQVAEQATQQPDCNRLGKPLQPIDLKPIGRRETTICDLEDEVDDLAAELEESQDAGLEDRIDEIEFCLDHQRYAACR